MKIGEHTIRNLAETLCGDNKLCPYQRGRDLVLLFNKYGFPDTYPESVNDAGSRRLYTEKRIRDLNGSSKLKTLIERLLDPRNYIGLDIKPIDSVSHINSFLKYDKYELAESGDFVILKDLDGNFIEPDSTKRMSQEFIQEQISKCNDKISTGDYRGAITNARSLVEAVCIDIIESIEDNKYKSDGNLKKIYGRTKKLLNLSIEKDYSQSIIQILSGLESIIDGLAGLSNKASDRHATVHKPSRHHAKIAVNSAIAFTDFIIDSYHYQQGKK